MKIGKFIREVGLEKIIYNYGKLDNPRAAAQEEDWRVYKGGCS